MTLLTSWANAHRSVAADALGPEYNSGKLRIYSGTRPTDANTAIGSQTLLAELTMNSTAFGAASNGVITANAITQDSAADATGTASFYRIFKSNGTTVLHDGEVGTSGANLNLSTTSIVAGQPVSCSSFTITVPLAGT
jgi:hypothetical protein